MLMIRIFNSYFPKHLAEHSYRESSRSDVKQFAYDKFFSVIPSAIFVYISIELNYKHQSTFSLHDINSKNMVLFFFENRSISIKIYITLAAWMVFPNFSLVVFWIWKSHKHYKTHKHFVVCWCYFYIWYLTTQNMSRYQIIYLVVLNI